MIKCFVLCVLLISFSDTYSQIVTKKDFRLKNSKPFFLNSETNSQCKTFAMSTGSKNLLVAGLLSFAVPGAALGQFYKEEFVNGGIRLGISVVCIIWFFVSPNPSFHGSGGSSQKLFAFGAYLINWIASIVDAAIPTQKKTKKPPPRGIYKISF